MGEDAKASSPIIMHVCYYHIHGVPQRLTTDSQQR